MKKLLHLIWFTALIQGSPCSRSLAQCPFPLSLSSSGNNCLGVNLSVNSSPGNTLTQIVWYNGGTAVKTVKSVTTNGSGITVAGLNGRGTADNQLNNPIGVAVDASSNVYIVDRLNNRVQKWAPGAITGVTVAGGNGQGTNPNQLSDPIGLFVDSLGNIYVGDFGNNRVQKWLPGSTSGITVAGGNGGGSAPGQLYEPIGVFVDGNGNVYVADAGNNRIQEWVPGAAAGITVAGGNGAGNAANQFDYPTGVILDNPGDIYVADEKNNRVQKWPPGSTSGITVAGGNGVGNAANQLNTPFSLFLDKNGDLYVDDQVNERIQEYFPGATSGITVAGGNGGGPAANQLLNPTGIYVTGNGDIYIADYGNNRIQKWGPQSTIDNSYTPSAAGTYSATATNNNGCTTNSNSLVISPVVSPSLHITGSATNLCSGTPETFTAIPVNGGMNPNWQWQINGINVGADSAAYTSSTLSAGDVVTCLLTSSATCASPETVSADSITISIGSPVTPAVKISASSTTLCEGQPDQFSASVENGGSNPFYQWQVNGINTGNDSSIYTSGTIANGDTISCLITSNAGCVTSTTAQSNLIPVIVYPKISSSISIQSSATAICAGMPVSFTASFTNAGSQPVFQWQVNGLNTGTNSPNYTSNHLTNGDSILCLLSSPSACISAISNSIPITVNPSPQVDSGQSFSLTLGQSITLSPTVSGNIERYSWFPATGLSNPSIADPVASPLKSTLYTLQVESKDGCQASGEINVEVFAPVRIPNAFTPNGDGRNDVFYVLGGPEGSHIHDFLIFNRWGQPVFQVQDCLTGDPNFGWDGNINGKKAPPGSYVYQVTIALADGSRQLFQGPFLLIR